MIARICMLLFLATIASAGVAQTDVPNDEVTVEGLTAKQTHALVRSVVDAKRGSFIPAFRESLCVRVQGLRQPYADLLRARIDDTARQAGLLVRTGNCSANLLVIAPPDADKLAAGLVKTRPMLYGDPDWGMADPSLLATMRRPHPVRWFETVLLNRWGGGRWKLKANAQADKVAAYVILDARLMDGMSWSSVGDYVAMVALSNARMDAQYPANTTILSLFDDRAAGRSGPTQLTSFDRATLAALYNVDQNLTPDFQRYQLIRMIAGKAPIVIKKR